MRFSRLSLERYGRFQDCEIDFRSGQPDLHLIYGPNEAGKTTSLSAVSDLLFGFPTRSPFNFLFDYSLLRVGAVLEDDGTTLACRRKKGANGTLLDESDITIDEAPLAAMLKGQTRETFGLSFSLDQDALRAGGHAMVEARNDVGRTLFAAGSGLTRVADELKRLEAEADAIWGPTTKKSRTFTQAQRQFADAAKVVRDEGLKPKAWSDAKAATERTREALDAARMVRNDIQDELRSAERVRRLAPLVSRRQEQLDKLGSFDGTVDLGRPREDAVENLIRDANEALGKNLAAKQLRADVAERLAKVSPDPEVLAEADLIDRLVAEAGAELKASRDLASLQAEHAEARASVRRLRAEAGANADAAPPRDVAARLRELSSTHGELTVASRQIFQSREGVEDRRRRAAATLKANPVDDHTDAITNAVDAARALGTEVDARCEATRSKVDVAEAKLMDLAARLKPWRGHIGELARLPRVDATEIQAERDTVIELTTEIRREEDTARRASDQAAAIALEVSQLATGAAVSAEEIKNGRRERAHLWQPLRRHVLDGEDLEAPAEAVARFEASVATADEREDARFASADASGRLSWLTQTRASHHLEKDQADERAKVARNRLEAATAAWRKRLASVGLPELDPAQFQSWQTDREAAEAAQSDLRDMVTDADRWTTQRDATRAGLCLALGVSDSGGELAPVLAAAERRRASVEEVARKRLLAQSEMDQVEADGAALDRRQQRVDIDTEMNRNGWKTALTEAGLDIDIVSCGVVLDLLDELREATGLEARLRRQIDGIARDAQKHSGAVGQLADRLGVEPGDTVVRLRTLRERLAAARASETLIGSLDEEDRRRQSEAQEAHARLKAIEELITPALVETRSDDRTQLLAAIERSRDMRSLRDEIAAMEKAIVDAGDGLALHDLLVEVEASDPDRIAKHLSSLSSQLGELNLTVDEAATAHGDARSTFAGLNTQGTSAVDAAADAEQARSEMEVLSEHYILKRAQAVTLKWAIEKYRERHQDPLLLRAGDLFSMLTIGRFATLKVDADGPTPRLLGLRDDLRTMVEVDVMSEGTTDQLFLALRLAALEQSVAAGICLPFLADDLFVNFDDQRAEAGFRVLADVARSTQVLFFTHHPHLVEIAKSVVGPEMHSECSLS